MSRYNDNPAEDGNAAGRTDARADDVQPCEDCGRPCRWVEEVGDYQHVEPGAPDCFLIQRHNGSAVAERTEARRQRDGRVMDFESMADKLRGEIDPELNADLENTLDDLRRENSW